MVLSAGNCGTPYGNYRPKPVIFQDRNCFPPQIAINELSIPPKISFNKSGAVHPFTRIKIEYLFADTTYELNLLLPMRVVEHSKTGKQISITPTHTGLCVAISKLYIKICKVRHLEMI